MTEPQDAAAVRIFPPGVPLLAILAAVALDGLWPLDLGAGLPAPARFWIGGAIVAGTVLGLRLGVILMNGWLLQRYAILPEEAYLERRFGEDYLDYKRRVRRWI